jgi:hypothetical protein
MTAMENILDRPLVAHIGISILLFRCLKPDTHNFPLLTKQWEECYSLMSRQCPTKENGLQDIFLEAACLLVGRGGLEPPTKGL